ncbi:glucokinase [Thetidibacter halocola]|uniref:Glucokinase n=1 Tax=Thetidibacter halocola TaxID=2827239 RepID=A0A8J7WCU4_9RHOB|nr:glucokinase [Thetidibacter halocola]MBS0124392.1 glucokinase [Thetidibacter halocola]
MSDPVLAVVADIGGTNTRVALARGRAVQADTIRRYRNADHPGIEPILQSYLKELGAQPRAVCVDMAGPVKDGVGKLTNLDWHIAAPSLAQATGAATVAVLNDLQAQGFAVGHVARENLRTILPADHAGPEAARLVVNVGTGLNAVAVYRSRGLTIVPPAEAGHISIPVQTDEELRLLHWLAEGHGTPGLEEVLSGRGLEHIHRFLALQDGKDLTLPADAIFAAFEAGEPRATRAARLFVRFMGRYAGNLALITLPFGGVFLVGGVVRHFAPHLQKLGFAEAFRDKGRFGPFMDQFPVWMVDDDYAALTGCAVHLSEILEG